MLSTIPLHGLVARLLSSLAISLLQNHGLEMPATRKPTSCASKACVARTESSDRRVDCASSTSRYTTYQEREVPVIAVLCATSSASFTTHPSCTSFSEY
ncbi:hypothetical protein FA13DRAFT_815168 [Coprinellus micaceus]|uniref:Secreted protein n=1 Tax=Coprinellus micaceus TaxID=71717 RepID=A0A4Y7T1Z2_COPMI|nr:hypothetical protein FA13DRAFT_815168 [Coprinellus micaceus]